jgi:hypothetical protein
VRVFALFGRPKFLKPFHQWAALAWLGFAVAGVFIGGLRASIPVLFFMSAYANVAGHWSSWQAATVELKQDEQNGDG